LLCIRLLILCSSICQSFLSVAEPFEFYWGSHCLCLLIPVFFALSYTSFKVSGVIFFINLFICAYIVWAISQVLY
jgi:hypothetical protein